MPTLKAKPRLRRKVKKPEYKFSVAAPALVAAVQQEFDAALDVMEAEWGFRPELNLKVEGMLRLSVDFNMKGFAHKGAGIYVRPTNLKRLTPRTIVQRLAGELVTHRNSCERCGVLLPALWERIRFHEERQKARPAWIDARQEWPRRPSIRWTDENGKGQWRDATDADLLKFYTPADAVERALFPGRSRTLDKLLAVSREQDRLANVTDPTHPDMSPAA